MLAGIVTVIIVCAFGVVTQAEHLARRLGGPCGTLAESPTHLVLLGVTLPLTLATFGGRRVTALHGAAHPMVFVLYGLAVFSR